MQFIIALYGLYKALAKQIGEQNVRDFILMVDQAKKSAEEAQTDAEKIKAAASLVDCLKRLG